MLLAEAGGVFVALLLYLSGFLGKANSICALKGSSVDLPCSVTHPTSSKKWYTAHWKDEKVVLKEIYVDGVTYNMCKESRSTLTINDLKESDEDLYYCRNATDNSEWTWSRGIGLSVTDLQVKVFPVTSTEGQRVTLTCSTSCPLTGSPNPTTYMWYKNGQFLYQDSSPWYQHLVSSEEGVSYSCAVQGYEHLRAPEVSVDSVTPTCFSVTYAEGRMCSFKQASVKEPCSITYPRELHVQMTPRTRSGQSVTLTCNTSCSLTDITPTWLRNGYWKDWEHQHQISVSSSSNDSFHCAVINHEDLRSPAVYFRGKNWVNCVGRRICALEGSSVDISCDLSYPSSQHTEPEFFIKFIKKTEMTTGEVKTEILTKVTNHVMYNENMENHHIILRIKNLTKSHSAIYTLRTAGWKYSAVPGVTLMVTVLTVKVTPAVVTEGQRVTLTCSTSCPLTGNTTYIWYQNRRPLTRPESQHKHLVLHPVSSQHAGKYSCAVKEQNISSPEETLAVRSFTGTWTLAAAAGIPAVLLTIVTLSVFLWIRRKRTSPQPPGPATPDNMEQLNPGPTYGNISAVARTSIPAAQSDATEQDDLPYSSVHFSKHQKDPLYSTVQLPQRGEEDVQYAVVNFNRPNTALGSSG